MSGENLDRSADLVVVGSGAAGFAAAITGRRAGLDVLLLERCRELGGTTARSGTWIWVPNNRLMRDAGLDDPRDAALRYMARLARPERFRRDDPVLGLPVDEYEMLAAFYDHAADAIDELAAVGALDPVMRADAPDYFAELPENAAPYGRVIVSRGRERGDQLTGRELIHDFASAARRLGVQIETDARVTDVIGSTDAVDGVVSRGRTIRARQGVVFATGGFALADDLMTEFIGAPLRATGAAHGAEGDFLRLGLRVGARLRNMGEAWMAPVPIELIGDRGALATNIFALRGDSMILADAAGSRVTNEKLPYHELTSVFLRWDPATASYPNLRLFMIFDEAARKLFADGKSGNPLPADNRDAAHVVTGDTWDDLVQRLGHRLETAPFEVSAGIRLAPHFGRTLRRTIERFNGDARRGVDRAFGRGTSAIELFRNGPPRPGHTGNPTLHPFGAGLTMRSSSLPPRSTPRADRPPTHTGGCSRLQGSRSRSCTQRATVPDSRPDAPTGVAGRRSRSPSPSDDARLFTPRSAATGGMRPP